MSLQMVHMLINCQVMNRQQQYEDHESDEEGEHEGNFSFREGSEAGSGGPAGAAMG